MNDVSDDLCSYPRKQSSISCSSCNSGLWGPQWRWRRGLTRAMVERAGTLAPLWDKEPAKTHYCKMSYTENSLMDQSTKEDLTPRTHWSAAGPTWRADGPVRHCPGRTGGRWWRRSSRGGKLRSSNHLHTHAEMMVRGLKGVFFSQASLSVTK